VVSSNLTPANYHITASERAITTDPGSGGKYFSSNSKTTDDEFA